MGATNVPWVRAAIYARISHDTAGTGLGVARQQADCHNLADHHGWTVTDVLIDNDRSAYTGRPRPGYQQVLDLLAARSIDVVVAWHPDRLHRSPRELEDFIDLLEAADATVATVSAGAVDLATASGRMTARVVGAVARHESEHKSERLRRKALELAEAGKVGSGGTRAFGYEADMVTIREPEAAHIRTAVDMVLAGASLRSVLAAWNTAGVAPVMSSRWQPSSLRRMLTSPRIAGLREHHGRTLGPAVWPGIITARQHERVVALVVARAGTRGPSRRYLLTGGVAVCGLCGNGLCARPKGGGARCYVCASDQGGCGKIRVLADPLEAHVTAAVLTATADGRFATVDDTTDARTAVLGDLEDLAQRQDHLAVDRYTQGDLGDAAAGRRYRAAALALDDRLVAARARLVALDEASATIDARNAADGLSGRWEAMGVEERRRTVAALIDTVVLGPAVKGRNFFDPARVSVRWRA